MPIPNIIFPRKIRYIAAIYKLSAAVYLYKKGFRSNDLKPFCFKRIVIILFN